MSKQWFKDVVVYQIYPMSFQDSNNDGIGDLNGIKQRLPYLKKLGVDVIWLNPIYRSPNKDNGYDISNYEEIQPTYGTMEDFNHLLSAVHQSGMKLIMDLVPNHTSDEHPWFQESKRSKSNPYADYYIWHDPVNGTVPNNWGSNFSGSAWEYSKKRNQYYLHSFATSQPDLNWKNPEVRNSIYKVMKFWLDKGIDGFRMDAIQLLSKPDYFNDGNTIGGGKYCSVEDIFDCGPHLSDYIQEMNRKVLSKYNIMTVGEMGGHSSPKEAIQYANINGGGINMIFQFEHIQLAQNRDPRFTKWNDDKINLIDLKDVFSRWENDLNGKSWNSLYWDNHDQPRAVSRFATDDPKYRIRAAKMLATTLHMLQGTPYIYEGEELGMTNANFKSLDQYEDIESINAYHQLVDKEKLTDGNTMLKYLAHMSRDNARTPMQWDNTKFSSFSNVKPWYALNDNYREINANQELNDKHSVYYYYQELIRLRHQLPIIRYGDYSELDHNDKKVFAYQRHYQGQELLVINNFTAENLTRNYEPTKGTLILNNYSDTNPSDQFRPYESKVYLFK